MEGSATGAPGRGTAAAACSWQKRLHPAAAAAAAAAARTTHCKPAEALTTCSWKPRPPRGSPPCARRAAALRRTAERGRERRGRRGKRVRRIAQCLLKFPEASCQCELASRNPIRSRAALTRPAWRSTLWIRRLDFSTSSLETTSFSTARTTPSLHLMPSAVLRWCCARCEGPIRAARGVHARLGASHALLHNTSTPLGQRRAPAVIDRLLRVVGLEYLAIWRVGRSRQIVLCCKG